jgi:hypothetical protein
MPTPHFLAPPWGLPAPVEKRLVRHLAEGDNASALVLLRDHVPEQPADPRLLLILAHVRFRDAVEVMVDELLPASMEALALIDRAVAAGVDPATVQAFRTEVEQVLSEQTAAELRTFAAIPEDRNYAAMELETLVDAAYRNWDADPATAAAMFEAAAAKRAGSPAAFNERLRAGLCRAAAGEAAKARPVLLEATTFDWKAAGLWMDRSMSEAAFVALLEQDASDEAAFARRWDEAVARGAQLERPFPSIWPNQEKLLDLCLARGDGPRAKVLAGLVEGSREELSKALAAKIRAARALAEGGATH